MDPAAPPEQIVRHLKDLATAMQERGWRAVLKGGTREPVLWIRNPDAADLNETILCKRQADGNLAYCWSWSEPIASVAEISTVADRIVYVLRCLVPKP